MKSLQIKLIALGLIGSLMMGAKSSATVQGPGSGNGNGDGAFALQKMAQENPDLKPHEVLLKAFNESEGRIPKLKYFRVDEGCSAALIAPEAFDMNSRKDFSLMTTIITLNTQKLDTDIRKAQFDFVNNYSVGGPLLGKSTIRYRKRYGYETLDSLKDNEIKNQTCMVDINSFNRGRERNDYDTEVLSTADKIDTGLSYTENWKGNNSRIEYRALNKDILLFAIYYKMVKKEMPLSRGYVEYGEVSDEIARIGYVWIEKKQK
jgi:hypothetical protein